LSSILINVSSLRSAIAAGIGLFLGIIALSPSGAGIVVANPATIVGLGDLSSAPALFAILGFIIIAALDALKVRGAILIGILTITVLSMITGHNQFNGVFSAPPSIAPTFLQLDIMGALSTGIVHVILVLVLVEVFDATGTLVGVAKRANVETGSRDLLKTPGYGLVDVSAWWQVTEKGPRLQAGIYNLFDKKYWDAVSLPTDALPQAGQDYAFYSEPGRSFKFSIVQKF